MVASGCFPACPIEGQCPNHSRSVNGCLRLSPCMPHCGPVSTITRDQSMVASGCLPACPIEGQCVQSLEISQWVPRLSPCMPHCGPVCTITRDQSMVSPGCLPACPIEEWALLMHMFEVQSRIWKVEPYQPMVELYGWCISVMTSGLATCAG